MSRMFDDRYFEARGALTAAITALSDAQRLLSGLDMRNPAFTRIADEATHLHAELSNLARKVRAAQPAGGYDENGERRASNQGGKES